MSNKVLIGCEESQAVCIEFRKLGIEAYSCDIQECSGNHPEWHFKDDILKVIMGGYLQTENNETVFIDKWDMMVVFPPCTHLAVSGAPHFEQKRKDGRQQQGIDFFMSMINAPIDRIAVENPIGIMSNIYKLPTQIIQPYYFGDPFQKSTCLWLKNLLPLIHNDKPNLFESDVTHTKDKGEFFEWVDSKNGITKKQPMWYYLAFKNAKSKEERSRLRSKTFPGIAKAMATQWSKEL